MYFVTLRSAPEPEVDQSVEPEAVSVKSLWVMVGPSHLYSVVDAALQATVNATRINLFILKLDY